MSVWDGHTISLGGVSSLPCEDGFFFWVSQEISIFYFMSMSLGDASYSACIEFHQDIYWSKRSISLIMMTYINRV